MLQNALFAVQILPTTRLESILKENVETLEARLDNTLQKIVKFKSLVKDPTVVNQMPQ